MRFTTLLASLGVVAVTAAAAHAADVELTLSHWVPPTHPLQPQGMEPWAESIKEASDGRIEITIYPSQQLGAAPDHYDMARDGIVDIAFINPGYQAGRFPIIAAAELPFLASNAKGGSRAVDEWYRQYAAKEMSDVYVCMVHLHDPGTLHAKSGPLAVPSDLEGKSVRPPNGTMAQMFSSLGAANVQVSAPEMRDALDKGTADMTGSPWGSLFTFGVQDTVKYHLDVPLYATVFAFVMNKDRIDSLSPEDRKVMDEHCTPEWAEKMASGWADAEAAGRQKIIDLGDHVLHKPTPEEMELWHEAAAPTVERWKTGAQKAGIDPDAALSDLKDRLEKYDSLQGQ
ncbi:TRAP transporter substrate-binding protein [Amorphus sp. 3PC139-8]|uniref:TRAP transporter substrate-binding protein n=1 Tax=Amorphus sp. 3PC139-8 TaxID=2735676 RepID=UPI00345DF6A8